MKTLRCYLKLSHSPITAISFDKRKVLGMDQCTLAEHGEHVKNTENLAKFVRLGHRQTASRIAIMNLVC